MQMHCHEDLTIGHPKEYPKEKTILEPNTVQIATITANLVSSFVERVQYMLEEDEYYMDHWIENPSDDYILNNGIPYFQDRLYVPEGPLRLEVLSTCHEAKLAGHYGKRKTAELVVAEILLAWNEEGSRRILCSLSSLWTFQIFASSPVWTTDATCDC